MIPTQLPIILLPVFVTHYGLVKITWKKILLFEYTSCLYALHRTIELNKCSITCMKGFAWFVSYLTLTHTYITNKGRWESWFLKYSRKCGRQKIIWKRILKINENMHCSIFSPIMKVILLVLQLAAKFAQFARVPKWLHASCPGSRS